ncbi:hypothetical protein V8E55_010687 [Tylopilus felleus]
MKHRVYTPHKAHIDRNIMPNTDSGVQTVSLLRLACSADAKLSCRNTIGHWRLYDMDNPLRKFQLLRDYIVQLTREHPESSRLVPVITFKALFVLILSPSILCILSYRLASSLLGSVGVFPQKFRTDKKSIRVRHRKFRTSVPNPHDGMHGSCFTEVVGAHVLIDMICERYRGIVTTGFV